MAPTRPNSNGRGNRASMLLSLAFLAVLSGFFRFYRLHTLPIGLYHDEGMNGNDALTALRTGVWHVFYSDNNGREGLFINLQAISIWLFGPTPWALRAVSAVMGVLAVLGLYMLMRDLWGERHALVAGILHSLLIWPVLTRRGWGCERRCRQRRLSGCCGQCSVSMSVRRFIAGPHAWGGLRLPECSLALGLIPTSRFASRRSLPLA
jgi:Dolichyl-phosphate-mannose-protein mannosyltransferase